VKILITGGLGLLGGRLGAYFHSNKHSVTLATRRNFISSQASHIPNIKVIDWSSREKLEKLCKSNDLVIHSAGISSTECERRPEESIKASSLNSQNLIDASVSMGVKSFIYLSSAHVYTKNMEGIIDESSPTTNNHPYAQSHLHAEGEVLSSKHTGKINVKVLRLSNCFGYPVFKNSNAWTLIANDLCRQAVSNGSLLLNSNINTQRDFLPIEELCKIINRLFERNTFDENQTIFNLGSGVTLTLFQLGEIIQKVSQEILGLSPSLYSSSSSIDSKLNPFLYKSKFLNMNNNNAFDTAIEKELKMLIHHCKSEFIK
jgi:UDP-glucose 4-epimerase